jgi:hypothetical protein
VQLIPVSLQPRVSSQLRVNYKGTEFQLQAHQPWVNRYKDRVPKMYFLFTPRTNHSLLTLMEKRERRHIQKKGEKRKKERKKFHYNCFPQVPV